MSSSASRTPLVSIIVPTYNSAHYLGEALNSIRAQTFQDFEMLVVDDGSTDETAQLLQNAADLRYFQQERQGSGAARNVGVEKARGKFIAFLDADDLWAEDKLALQIAAWNDLQKNGSPTLVFAHARQFFSPELNEKSRFSIRLPDAPQAAPLPGTLFITRTDFLSVGPYIEGLGQSLDWFLRARDSVAQIHTLTETLLFRRIHSSNMSRTQTHERHLYIRSLKNSLDRRRQRPDANRE